jgi:hypothetical protein
MPKKPPGDGLFLLVSRKQPVNLQKGRSLAIRLPFGPPLHGQLSNELPAMQPTTVWQYQPQHPRLRLSGVPIDSYGAGNSLGQHASTSRTAIG